MIILIIILHKRRSLLFFKWNQNIIFITYVTQTDIIDSSVGNLRILLGDWNAKLGQEIRYGSCIKTHSLHTVTNDNGSKLIDFGVDKGLIVKCTMFSREDIYNYMWVSQPQAYLDLTHSTHPIWVKQKQ